MKDNYDKLDEFFRRQMLDDTPDPSWNVPDDSLFEGALAKVHHNPKAFDWKRLLIIVPFFFLGALGIYEYQKGIEFSQLQSELETLQDEVAVFNSSVSSMQDALGDQSTVVSELKVTNTDLQEELEGLRDQFNSSVVSQSLLRDKLNESLTANDQLASQVSLLQEQLSNQSVIASDEEISAKQVIDFDKLPSLGLTNVTSQINNSQSFVIDDQRSVDLPKDTKFSPYWSIGVDAIINSSWVTMTDLPSTGVEQLGGYKNANLGIGTQVMVEYQATPRWSFNGGLGFNRFENRSSFEASFFFDTKYVEQDANGDDVYVVDLEMQNPYGDYDSEASFRVSEDMRQNCLVEEFTQVRQKLDVFTLAAGAKYRIIDREKFGLYVGAGLGVNAISSIRNEFDVSLVMAGTLRHNYRDVTYNMQGLNRLYASGSLSAGLNYNINDKLSFNLEGQYNRGLTSIRDSWPNAGPNTYLHNVASNIGLRYRLD